VLTGTLGLGVFHTVDHQSQWAPINTGLENLAVSALAADPTAPGTLYAGTFNGVFRTTDNGGP
jgi:hypothetical protein